MFRSKIIIIISFVTLIFPIRLAWGQSAADNALQQKVLIESPSREPKEPAIGEGKGLEKALTGSSVQENGSSRQIRNKQEINQSVNKKKKTPVKKNMFQSESEDRSLGGSSLSRYQAYFGSTSDNNFGSELIEADFAELDEDDVEELPASEEEEAKTPSRRQPSKQENP